MKRKADARSVVVRPLVVLAVMLAGCSGPSAVPEGIPVDAHGDPLPTLHGVVVDEAIRPLAGATVRFVGGEVAAITDPQGLYEIHRPTMRAEAVVVSASLEGFRSRAQQAEVSGHRSTQMDFVLETDPDVVPHVVVLQDRGVLRCTAGVAAVGQAEGVLCDGEKRDENDQLPPWMWDINPRPNLAGAVVEVHWQALTPLSSQLHAWLKAPVAGDQGGQVIVDLSGPSPLRLEVPADVAEALPRWISLRLHVDLAEGQDGIPGAAPRDQSFDAFASLFYVDAAPPGYTLG